MEADAAVMGIAIPIAAVDGDFVAAGDQARGKLFGERFEAAVVGWNAARAEKGDAHSAGQGTRRVPQAYPTVSERESIRIIFFEVFLLTGLYWNQLAMYS